MGRCETPHFYLSYEFVNETQYIFAIPVTNHQQAFGPRALSEVYPRITTDISLTDGQALVKKTPGNSV